MSRNVCVNFYFDLFKKKKYSQDQVPLYYFHIKIWCLKLN